MSNDTFPQHLSEIDDLTRPDHCFLMAADKCLCFGDYTARAGFEVGPTNNLIFNFKKKMDRKGRPEWKYKERAIEAAAEAFSKALNPKFLEKATLVPIPPSRLRDDPLYDDRVLRMLKMIDVEVELDIRELIVQTTIREAAHDGERPGPEGLAALYGIDERLAEPAPKTVALFDDLLVTGASFKAAEIVLKTRFPEVKIYGLFLARRALPSAFEELFGDIAD